MRKIKDIVITDEMEEAMLDAIDEFGVYSYHAYRNIDKVMFVIMYDGKAA